MGRQHDGNDDQQARTASRTAAEPAGVGGRGVTAPNRAGQQVGYRESQQLAAALQALGAVAVGEKAVVADALEAAR